MAATGSAVISGHCVASLPAASPLGDKACDWASLALCACGDVGEAPTGRAVLHALRVSPVKALGPYGNRSTGAATLSLGQPQGRALAVWPGREQSWVEFGVGVGGRESPWVPVQPRAPLSTLFRGRARVGPAWHCRWVRPW